MPTVPESSQIQDAFATPLPFQKIFVAVKNHQLFDIFFRQARESRKFRGHPAKIAHHLACHFGTLSVCPIRKC
jgi:hypothetical protein